MTTNDERVLKLIRLERWLQRRNPCRLWVETTTLAIGFACLTDVLTVLSLEWFPPDPACPIVYDFALCLDTTGLSPWPVILGWVASVVLIVLVELIQWRRRRASGLRRRPSQRPHPNCSSALWGANILVSGISRRTLTDESYSESQAGDIDIE